MTSTMSEAHAGNPAFQVYLLLRAGFTVAPILFGLDIVNLLTYDPPLYYDIALRDVGLMLGALALWRLALAFRGAGDTSLRAGPERPRRAA